MASEKEHEFSAMEKLTRLMALFVVKGLPENESVVTLSICGLTNNEIAALLGKEPVTVRGHLHRYRKQTKRRKSK